MKIFWNCIFGLSSIFTLASFPLNYFFGFDTDWFLFVQIFVLMPLITYQFLKNYVSKKASAQIAVGSVLFFGPSMGYIGSIVHDTELDKYGVQVKARVDTILEQSTKKDVIIVKYLLNGNNEELVLNVPPKKYGMGDVINIRRSMRYPRIYEIVK